MAGKPAIEPLSSRQPGLLVCPPVNKMISVKRVNKSREKLHLPLLVFVLVLVACTAENGSDEASVAVISPTPELTIELATPVPPKEENSDEDIAISLVEAEVREIGRFDESVSVEVEKVTSVVSLVGLSLYAATPMVVDSLDDHCAVYGEEVWCSQEALQNIIGRFSLGTNPGQLSDDEWLALVSYFTYTTPLNGADDLGANAQSMPDSERVKISAPIIDVHESGGIDIFFYFEAEDIMGFGDLSLNILEVAVTADNALLLEHREIWHNLDPDE